MAGEITAEGIESGVPEPLILVQPSRGRFHWLGVQPTSHDPADFFAVDEPCALEHTEVLQHRRQ